MHDLFSAADAALLADLSDDLQAEAAALERDLAALRLRRRTMADALTEAAHRGETVTVHGAGPPVTGLVVHVGGDLMAIAVPEGPRLWLAVGAGIMISRSGGPPHRGRTADRTAPGTMRGLLRQIEVAGAPVRLLLTHEPHEIVATVRAVAVDHVLAVADGTVRWLLPIDSIAGAWDPPGIFADRFA